MWTIPEHFVAYYANEPEIAKSSLGHISMTVKDIYMRYCGQQYYEAAEAALITNAGSTVYVKGAAVAKDTIVEYGKAFYKALVDTTESPITSRDYRPAMFTNATHDRVFHEALGPIICLNVLRAELPKLKAPIEGNRLKSAGSLENPSATRYDFAARLENIDQLVRTYVRELTRIGTELGLTDWPLIDTSASCSATTTRRNRSNLRMY